MKELTLWDEDFMNQAMAVTDGKDSGIFMKQLE